MKSFILSLSFCVAFASSLLAADWSNWRGPTWSGNAVGELPTHWSETEGILWKTPLPPWGNSSPIVVGDSIFLTTQIDDDQLVLIRLNKADGKIVWEKEIASGQKTPRFQEGQEFRGWQKFNNYHNLASPAVVADSETILAHFGTGDLAAFDWNGSLLWKTNLQETFGDFMIWWGHANTPLLCGNLVIVPVMQDDLRDLPNKEPVESYLVAYDKNTGKQVWKVLRNTGSKNEYNDSYTSPVLWTHEGRVEMLVLGGETLDAYNPKTGERYWWLNKGLEGNRIVPSPVPCESLGLVFAVRGKREPVCCVAPKGLGEQPESALLWSHPKNPPDVSCPVVCNGLLFFTNDGGIATCVDPKTGDVHWEKRLAGGTYFPSLLADGNNVYYMNNEGTCTIIKADKEFEQVAQNKLDGTFLSSPAAVDGKLYIRSRDAIYCIGNRK
ncbi:MAG: PQQ-binding-like beta-propeller repeat protein [Planctomycetaceae bacterium]|nr:PQQ-binding-like beta-propeller repeat protein [Planctomycetaceae bacterium]